MSSDICSKAAGIPAPLCLATLFKAAFDGNDLKPLREQIGTRHHRDSIDAAADLISLSIIEQILGDQAAGLRHQAEALSLHRLYRSPWPASPSALRVLAFKAAGDVSTNTPIEFLLKGFDVVLYSLYIVPGQPTPEIPAHDIAVVTVGESDRDIPVFTEIRRLIRAWPCRVLNSPDRVPGLAREAMHVLLQGIPGVVVPATIRISRADLEKPGPCFPLIARPVGSHAGRGLAKLDDREAVCAWLARQSDDEFFISSYIDYRSADGQFRKYRIVWIEGRPFPVHMAIADQWKVWYYNADMDAGPAKRAEEEEFIAAFDEGFAHRHAAALAAIVQRFGLEYVGVDCAELPDGRLIVFEGDISLVVHDMDPSSLYPYKSPAAKKLFAAFYRMLEANRSMRPMPAFLKTSNGRSKHW
jgi:hypothetical protein